MITEKTFAATHAAFWRELLPLAENCVRDCNAASPSFVVELGSALPANMRGLVNETGFQIFAEAQRSTCPAGNLGQDQIAKCTEAASRHIAALRRFHQAPLRGLSGAGIAEAVEIAHRLEAFFTRTGLATTVIAPIFLGCGWLDQCQGDVLAGSVLFEVKAGLRPFRSIDLKQLLCYCALNFASKRHDISDFCLVNPRSGRYVSDSLESLCQRLAGRSATSVLSDIVVYISDPADRYAAG